MDLRGYKCKGELVGVPIEVVELMLREQVRQGNKEDIGVFEDMKWASVMSGGFNWDVSDEGREFWCSVLLGREHDEVGNRWKDSIRH